MTNAQLYILLLPSLLGVLATLAGFLMQGKRLDAMDDRFNRMDRQMDDRFNRIDATLTLIQRDLREFYATQKVHDEAIDTLKKQVKP